MMNCGGGDGNGHTDDNGEGDGDGDDAVDAEVGLSFIPFFEITPFIIEPSHIYMCPCNGATHQSHVGAHAASTCGWVVA